MARKNPRWIINKHDVPDEIDLEFVVSWLLDVEYAVKIAHELGRPDDVHMWQDKSAHMRKSLPRLVFQRPGEASPVLLHGSARLQQRNTSRRSGNHDSYGPLPEGSTGRTCSPASRPYFGRSINPIAPPTVSPTPSTPTTTWLPMACWIVAWPRQSPSSRRSFATRSGRRVCRGAPAGTGGEPEIYGVKPSLFTALNIIEFTWMLNHVRYESGTPTVFDPTAGVPAGKGR